MKERIAAIVTCAIVAVGVVLAFAVIGPPGHARLVAFDQRRVRDLDDIVNTISNDAGNTASRAPQHLSALTWLSMTNTSTHDPVTGKPYVYRVLGPRRYWLCATFALADEGNDNAGAFDNHPAGRVCRNFHF